MKISLVTPCYQSAQFLSETIESVLGQDYADFEYWIVDGGSTDGTREIIERHQGDPRLHWMSEPDQGQSHALAKGLQCSKGVIFNWLNADDLLLPGALSAVAKIFEETKADVVTGRTLEFCNESLTRDKLLELPVRRSAEQTLCRGIYCQPSTFWRMDILRDLGGVEEQLHYAMDWHLWVKYLARFGQSGVVRRHAVWARFRKHGNSKSMSCADGFHGEILAIYRKLIDNLGAADLIPYSDIELGGIPATTHVSDFAFGSHFNAERFLGCYCDRVTKRLYNAKRYAEASRWLSVGKGSFRKPTFWRMKMALRLKLANARA